MGKLAERLNEMPEGSQVYKLSALPEMLAQAGQYDRLYVVLNDFDFIQAKIEKVGKDALIYDYDLFFTPDATSSKDWSESRSQRIRAIQSALSSLSDNAQLTTIQNLLNQPA